MEYSISECVKDNASFVQMNYEYDTYLYDRIHSRNLQLFMISRGVCYKKSLSERFFMFHCFLRQEVTLITSIFHCSRSFCKTVLYNLITKEIRNSQWQQFFTDF